MNRQDSLAQDFESTKIRREATCGELPLAASAISLFEFLLLSVSESSPEQ